jgi:hypothetical protein
VNGGLVVAIVLDLLALVGWLAGRAVEREGVRLVY